jgi:hypothetical protein
MAPFFSYWNLFIPVDPKVELNIIRCRHVVKNT